MQYHNETPRSCAAWEAVVDGGSVDKDPAGRGAEIELTDGRPFDRPPDLDLAHRGHSLAVSVCWWRWTIGRLVGWHASQVRQKLAEIVAHAVSTGRGWPR
jgi:hypothetical protein